MARRRLSSHCARVTQAVDLEVVALPDEPTKPLEDMGRDEQIVAEVREELRAYGSR